MPQDLLHYFQSVALIQKKWTGGFTENFNGNPAIFIPYLALKHLPEPVNGAASSPGTLPSNSSIKIRYIGYRSPAKEVGLIGA
ncbi:hypothetical protein GCM10028804_40030 [Larkinella terrae]